MLITEIAQGRCARDCGAEVAAVSATAVHRSQAVSATAVHRSQAEDQAEDAQNRQPQSSGMNRSDDFATGIVGNEDDQDAESLCRTG